MRAKTICVDFDGVIHGYTSGWKGPTTIPDVPVNGAIAWLAAMVQSTQGEEDDPAFDVQVFSSRSSQEGGIAAMREYLARSGLASEVLAQVGFPTTKPAAHVSIDDRAMRFTGRWPTPAEVVAFLPWNRVPDPGDQNVHVSAECGEVTLQLGDNSFCFRGDVARQIGVGLDRAGAAGDWERTHVPRRELVILCGLPFSGLPQVARHLGGVSVNIEVVRTVEDGSRDRSQWMDESYRSAEERARSMVRVLWRSGAGRVVVVGCNPTSKDRDAWRATTDGLNASHMVQHVETDAPTCKKIAADCVDVPHAVDHVNQVAAVFEHPQGWWD